MGGDGRISGYGMDNGKISAIGLGDGRKDSPFWDQDNHFEFQ